MKPRFLLAAANWASLLILIWLLILGQVPLAGVQVFSLCFFFIVAATATMYDPTYRARKAGLRKEDR